MRPKKDMHHCNETKKEDIILVFKYFKDYDQKNRKSFNISETIKKISRAFKLSSTCIKDVIVNSKRKGKVSKSRKTKVDSFDQEVIRRTVHKFYDAKQLPTSTMILKKLENHDINISQTFLLKVMNKLGFVWGKVKENRKILIERHDIALSRINYLRTIKEYRNKGYNIVYLDETWINKNHCRSYTWLPKLADAEITDLIGNKNLVLPNIPSGKGQRLIILHAGSAKTGFIPNCDLVFLGKDVDGDYHKEMNSVVFLDWFENNLLKSLEEPSLIVLDNASYHDVRTNETKCPTSNNKKQEMVDWLSNNNIVFNSRLTKVELYDLIKSNKPPIKYVTDELAEYYGHKTLRTPVRHCELNPIELIWAQLKNFVAEHNSTFNMSDIKSLVTRGLQSINAETWEKAVEHTNKIEERFCKVDGLEAVNGIEPVIINFCNESDDDDSVCDESLDEG